MSLRHIGERIDIHGGGADLIFPHHENEIAQSEASTGKRPVVGWWVHGGLVRLGGKKMSKSDGNMVFVRDALARVSPEALRLYLLDAPYRRAFDHDDAKLDRAARRQRALAARLGVPARADRLGRDAASRAAVAALEDDLDVPRAIRLLERGSRTGDEKVRASLRAIAHGILGIV
jgi:cysteinyl-tRNA synthetase